jgi:exopolysaccharide biosynthesis polyprenyl glycosylphosphotransferase
MLRERAKIVADLLALADMGGLLVAFVVAYLLRNMLYGASRGDMSLIVHTRVLALALPIFAVSFYYCGLYQSFRLRSLLEETWCVVKACSWSTLMLILLIFFLKYDFVSRAFLVGFATVSCVSVAGQRLAIRSFARAIRAHGYNYRNIVIVGTSKRAREVAGAIREHSYWGLRILGQICEDDDSQADPSLRVLGSLRDFSTVLQGQVVDGVVLALPHDRLGEIKEAFTYCRQVGIPAYIYALPFDEVPSPVRMEELGEIKLLAFPAIPHNGYQLFWKRVFDVAASVLLLTLFAPFVLLAAILIKLSSPGPVLFRQARVGMNGRLFTCYKFRTMVHGADQMKAELTHLNEMDGPVFKIRNDPRTTRLGRFLRRTSLDELPQLFNVLAGHMSIVGPRPAVPDEVEKYEAWQRRRLSVRPGLTCLWQVNGRNRVDFETWMKLDLNYIDNWSWMLDLKIILRTIPAMLKGW